jgi:hypothetical protein
MSDKVIARRPPGRGHGLSGPVCGEHAELDQGRGRRPPCMAICVRCGRITGRRDADGMPWCGGGVIDREPWPVQVPPEGSPEAPPPQVPSLAELPAPARNVRYNPDKRHHSWARIGEHHRTCRFCRVDLFSECTTDRRTWWQTWKWPSGEAGTNQHDRDRALPRCPGKVLLPGQPDEHGPSAQ